MNDHPIGGDQAPTGAGAAASGAGERLRAAREAAGYSLADVAQRTRVPLRQLEAVEEGRYSALPSPTYAVGFAKAYARSVGADEVAVAAAVRDEIARFGVRQPDYVPYELPDPAKLPSRGVAILAAGAALAIVVLVALWYGTGLFGRAAAPPAPPTIAAVPVQAPVARPTPAPTPVPTGGQVRIEATGRVWMRIHDDDRTLFLGTMDPGNHFDVPADAKHPLLDIGRPDKIAVALNGRTVPTLSASKEAVKNLAIDGTAVAARLAGAGPGPGAAPTAAAAPAGDRPADRAAEPRRRESRGEGTRRPAPRVLSETQRANLDAARHPPAALGNSTQ